MNKAVWSLVVLVFLLGWVGNNAYSEIYKENYEFRMTSETTTPFQTFIISKERLSPQDRISEKQIHVYDDSVIIEIDEPEWSTFTDTNSMDPLLDKGANAIHIVPKHEDEVDIGDIVAYDSAYTEGTIIHRVVEVGYDNQGKYFIMKGDNNPGNDPGKVRFSQIKRVLVAIIY